MTEVALIDAGGANLGSVRYALERLGVQVRLVRDAKGLQGVSRVILPGVGAAPHGMARLHAQDLVQPLRESALLDGVPERASAYFVHSYAAPLGEHTVAACDHGGLFAAVVQRGLHSGAQFHPERSAATGARILRNFIENEPS